MVVNAQLGSHVTRVRRLTEAVEALEICLGEVDGAGAPSAAEAEAAVLRLAQPVTAFVRAAKEICDG